MCSGWRGSDCWCVCWWLWGHGQAVLGQLSCAALTILLLSDSAVQEEKASPCFPNFVFPIGIHRGILGCLEVSVPSTEQNICRRFIARLKAGV